MVQDLLQIFNTAKRYQATDIGLVNVNNGVYVVFEPNEILPNGLNRVVRIGINKSGAFKDRLKKHFVSHNRGSSVFIKHVGRALISKDSKQHLLPKWMDRSFKSPEIEQYIKRSADFLSRCSFCVICVPNREMRESLEAKLVSTFSYNEGNTPTENWLGRYHNDVTIGESGLWNIEHTGSDLELSVEDALFISKNLVR